MADNTFCSVIDRLEAAVFTVSFTVSFFLLPYLFYDTAITD